MRLDGELPEGATATDLVLTVTELLRATGVVGKFVEFYGPGISRLPLADRATLGNMSPEFGSTCAIFPIDAETIRYLQFTGRPAEQVALVEAYAKEQGLWHDEHAEEPTFSSTVVLDLGTVEPSLAGPRRPQDRVPLRRSRDMFREELTGYVEQTAGGEGAVATPVRTAVPVTLADGTQTELAHGHVVIAAITSCTNTSNPSVMLAAGLLARNARARGLTTRPWVKTSLAPGSKVVTDYFERAELQDDLDALGFNLVGYGCTTCIGNSGPLPDAISAAVNEHDLTVCSVLSGNRNFEGRINPDVKMNYLASPPLVVAYAIAGTMDIDLVGDPIGQDASGADVHLRDIWPSAHDIAATVEHAVQSDMFRKSYAQVYDGDVNWSSLDVPDGDRYAWDESSTYVRNPPYFEDMPREPLPVRDILGARVLARLGDSVTTDHISPAGAIKKDSPAGHYLMNFGVGGGDGARHEAPVADDASAAQMRDVHGVEPKDFNSYGSRRGNHEVMMRGTFANIRLRNLLAPGTEGGVTRHLPRGEEMSIFDAAMRYQREGTPLIVLGGKEYGSGSSRDWAAKGTNLLGVRAVLAESFERIHRSNLVGMGVLPLQFCEGQSAKSLGLSGQEIYEITGLAEPLNAGELPRHVTVNAGNLEFQAMVRIDTPKEADYFRHGGILQYVLRQLAAG
jgi:aconitate hydratase